MWFCYSHIYDSTHKRDCQYFPKGEWAVLFPCSVDKITHVIVRHSAVVAFERTEKIIRCRCGLCEPVWLWKIE